MRKRRLRRSNGSGTISLSNRKDLRKPWYVKVTVGHVLGDDGKLHQKRKLLGYYETEELATIALGNYCEKASRLGTDDAGLKTTIKEMWDDFVAEQTGKNISESRRKAYGYTWLRLPDRIRNATFGVLDYKTWADMFIDLRDNQKVGYSTLKRIRTDTAMMYDYAEKRGIEVKNYPRMFKLGKSPRKGMTLVFRYDEIKQLWNMYINSKGNDEAQFTVKVVLMLIYNGCRIQEFLDLKSEDVHMSDHYFTIVDAKTPAGVRRIPINKHVYPIYQELYNATNEYFLTNPKTNGKYSYGNFRDSYWDRLRNELGWNENMTPHNARKTFASYIKFYHLDYTCQKLILGHEGALDLQEKTYAITPLSTLVQELDKLPAPLKLADLKDEVL